MVASVLQGVDDKYIRAAQRLVVQMRVGAAPQIIGPARSAEREMGHGESVTITRTRHNCYMLRGSGEPGRVRFASTLADVRDDVAHFLQTGALPRSKGSSWA